MWHMAKRDPLELAKDVRRLDNAIGLVEAILDAPLPDGTLVAPQVLKIARDSRLQAADRLVSLLERRAKLLGLDAPEEKSAGPSNGSGTLAELEQKLALVRKHGAS